jgi:EAL domain-containing protein (putative c-di-GMP-specific phosphodiesterase class I)
MPPAQRRPQTGLVLTIGPWMLRRACKQLRIWRDEGGAEAPPIHIDLTTYLTQDPDLVELVQSTLSATQHKPATSSSGWPLR